MQSIRSARFFSSLRRGPFRHQDSPIALGQLTGKAVAISTILAMIGLASGTAFGQAAGQSATGAGGEVAAGAEPGQQPTSAAGGAAAPALVPFTTSLTFQSYSIPAGGSQGNLEGASCGTRRMISGACHPFYNDRVTIINQFPNIAGNTWRCGFKNNTAVAATVFIYTVCAQ
jgi:hypothetical protein